MHLIRLTEITDNRGDVDTLVNADYIRRVEAIKAGDRYQLRLWMNGETRMRDFAAVDVLGRNTLSEESAEDVLDQFRLYLKE